MMWIAGDSLFLISENGNLISIKIEDGSIRWITNLPYKIEENLVRFQKFIVHYGPIVASERVYLVSSDNKLRIYNYHFPKSRTMNHLQSTSFDLH